ncbi:Uncharacterised protein [Candidatus Tiddalikarchaeum anstoanum]|nr:Uncharacterised protein [Candidatus Tiddalikarchaeum anstoanum]
MDNLENSINENTVREQMLKDTKRKFDEEKSIERQKFCLEFSRRPTNYLYSCYIPAFRCGKSENCAKCNLYTPSSEIIVDNLPKIRLDFYGQELAPW